MSKIIRLIDRSRVDAREECERLRFLNYDFDGDGIEPEAGSLPLMAGIAIHNAHARLLGGEDLDVVIASTVDAYRDELAVRGLATLEVTPAFVREQCALLEGMLRMWYAVRLPVILAEYDVVSIEKRFDWMLAPGLVQRLRYDAVLRRKDDGLLFILDYKTVGYPSEVWSDKFEHTLQTCLYLQALKEHTAASGEEVVGGILYEGLVKGQLRYESSPYSPFYGQKVQQSPYTIAYALENDGMALYRTEYTSRKGWHKVRPYERMPMKDWVDLLIAGGEGITSVSELFVSVPALMPPAAELLRVKAQVIREELEWFEKLDRYRLHLQQYGPDAAAQMLDVVAPYRTGHCFKYGRDHKCKFVDVCFISGMEPLDNGFVKRKPHHDTDLKMVA